MKIGHLVAVWILAGISGSLLGCAQVEVANVYSRCDFSSDPRLSVLRGKFPLSPQENGVPPSLNEVVNQQFATTAEIKAIILFDKLYQPCVVKAMNLVNRHLSSHALIFARLRQYTIEQQKLLTSRRITFATYRQNSYDLMLAAGREIKGEKNALLVTRANSIKLLATRTNSSNVNIGFKRREIRRLPQPERM